MGKKFQIEVGWSPFEKNIEILDTAGQQISKVIPESKEGIWKVILCCVANGQMAVFSESNEQLKLSLWDVRNPWQVVCLQHRSLNLNTRFDACNFSIEMDENFIAVWQFKDLISYHFFSIKTLELQWQKTFISVKN